MELNLDKAMQMLIMHIVRIVYWLYDFSDKVVNAVLYFLRSVRLSQCFSVAIQFHGSVRRPFRALCKC